MIYKKKANAAGRCGNLMISHFHHIIIGIICHFGAIKHKITPLPMQNKTRKAIITQLLSNPRSI